MPLAMSKLNNTLVAIRTFFQHHLIVAIAEFQLQIALLYSHQLPRYTYFFQFMFHRLNIYLIMNSTMDLNFQLYSKLRNG